MKHLIPAMQEQAKQAGIEVYELKHHELLSKSVPFSNTPCPIQDVLTSSRLLKLFA